MVLGLQTGVPDRGREFMFDGRRETDHGAVHAVASRPARVPVQKWCVRWASDVVTGGHGSAEARLLWCDVVLFARILTGDRRGRRSTALARRNLNGQP